MQQSKAALRWIMYNFIIVKGIMDVYHNVYVFFFFQGNALSIYKI